ncbi:MAG: hypothetical protein Kow00108_18750 [Calditrichia bacterium]
MVKGTYATAVILILLGIISYIISNFVSVTALIPTFIGILFLIAAFIGSKEQLRKHAMHATSLLALIGLIGAGRGVGPFFKMVSGTPPENETAVIAQAIMFLVCGIYLFFAIRSFVLARVVNKPE